MPRILALFLSLWILAPLVAASPPIGESIGWQTARFFASEEAAARPRTSLALPRWATAHGPIPDDFAFEPEWRRADDLTTIIIEIPRGSSLYGLGRAPGPLLRAGTFGAEAAPWVLGIRDDGSGFGVLLDTTWASTFDLGDTEIRIETGDPDPVLIIFGDGVPAHIVTGLLDSSGPMEIPPLWSLGIQIDAPLVERIDGAADGIFLPCQLITIGQETCLDSPMADRAEQATPWRMASGSLTLDPGVLEAVSEEGSPRDAPRWVRSESGEVLEIDGRIIPDFTDPETRRWWQGKMAALGDRSASGVAILATPLPFVPDSAQLAGDPDHGSPATMRQYRGAFEYLALRATWDGFDPFEHDRRPLFTFPTSAIGSQRWNGHLIGIGAESNMWGGGARTPRDLIARALNSSLSAQPMVGASLSAMNLDEWLAWLGAAGMMPLVHISGMPEDDQAAQVLAALAEQRRQILPYLYTVMFHTMYQAQPFMQPVFAIDPSDPALRDVDNAFLIGRDLLVVPPLGEEMFDPAQLDGTWRRLPLGSPDDRLPALYIRPGAIIPLAPEGMSVSQWELDPVIIAASLNDEGHATGMLYEDDWHDYALFRGGTRRITYDVRQEGDTAFVRLMGLDGGRNLPQRELIVRLLTDDRELTAIGSERGTIRIPLVSGQDGP